MEVQVDRTTTGSVAVAAGEADADNCHLFREALLDKDLGARLEVDLSRLTFLDSSAVSELLGIHTALAEAGTTMVIADVSPAVHRVLEITGLLDVFGIEK